MWREVLFEVLKGVQWFFKIFTWLIIINAFLSWVVDPSHPMRALVGRIISPIVAPFRALTDRLRSSQMPIDFSPIFAYIVLQILIVLIERFRYWIIF